MITKFWWWSRAGAIGIGIGLVAPACTLAPEAGSEDDVVAQSAALSCDAEVPAACPDGGAPVLEAHSITLWPPNHKFHTITAWDCVNATDACGGPIDAHFTSVTSDEPADAHGDGHHAPDIIVDSCSSVQLRAERQGPGDGRVYTLELVATNQDGESVHGTCTVIVPHDMAHLEAGNDGPAVTLDVCPEE